MDLGLAGKSVLVMAGSRGIGLAAAEGFAREGAEVAIAARSAEALAAAETRIPGVLALRGDVTIADDIGRIVAAATEHLGGIDILVNNAGGPPSGAFEELDDAAWAGALELTLMSAIRATRAVLPGMRKARWGRIVNISSYGVKQPVPGLTLSNRVRMAVLGWAKTLSQQVAGDNILVNTVCPGWTLTERVAGLAEKQAAASGGTVEAFYETVARTIPLGRLGTAQEIANLIVFLGSEAAGYMTGTAIQVDGGLTAGYA